MKTLLDKARAYRSKQSPQTKFTDAEVDLFIGWLKSEYGITALNSALDIENSTMGTYVDICRGLRQAYKEGKIKA